MMFRVFNYGSFALISSVYALFGKLPDCDVIFVSQTSPVFQAIPALICKWRTKKPVVLYCYDLWPESMKAWGVGESNLVFRIVRGISSSIYRSCDIIAITSRPFRRYLTEFCGVDDNRIVYLPQYAEDIYANIAGQYEDNDCIDFLFAGNLGAVQNVSCILRAASKVETAHLFCTW
jgi:hypothetical protein